MVSKFKRGPWGWRDLYSFNIITTKTNVFLVLTKFFTGEVIFTKTPRMLGYEATQRRTKDAGYHLLVDTIKALTLKFGRNLRSTPFVVRLRGSNKRLQFFLCKNLLKMCRFWVVSVVSAHLIPHNGCPLEIKKP